MQLLKLSLTLSLIPFSLNAVKITAHLRNEKGEWEPHVRYNAREEISHIPSILVMTAGASIAAISFLRGCRSIETLMEAASNPSRAAFMKGIGQAASGTIGTAGGIGALNYSNKIAKPYTPEADKKQ